MPNNIRDPEKNFFPLIFGSISKILASLKSKYHGRQGLGMFTQWLRLSCCFANCIGWSILQMRFFIFDGNIIRHKPLALCCFHVSFDFIFTTFMVFLQTISLFSLSLPTRSLVAANRVNFCLLRFSSKPEMINKSSKDRTWSAVPDALLGVISWKIEAKAGQRL